MDRSRRSILKATPQVLKLKHTTTEKATARQKEKRVPGGAAPAPQRVTPNTYTTEGRVRLAEDSAEVSKQVLGPDCGGGDTREELPEGTSFSTILTLAYLGQGHISGPQDLQQGDTASKHSTK